MTARSRFSIVIDNFNYAPFLEAALGSALGQEYPADAQEVIVVDDGSTDASRELLRRHAGHPRLRIHLQENAGQAAAFASGVALARHEYVCLLDADDAFRPDKLAKLDAHISRLGGGEDLFLCHDLDLHDTARGKSLEPGWFEHLGIAPAHARMALADVDMPYAFSVPTGQVFSRALLASILEGVPLGDWRTGADNPIAHAAMLRVGAVHYLHDRLARYTLHGGNRLLQLDAMGRLQGRPNAHPLLLARRPKLLWFLERYLDTLPLAAAARAERIDYLVRLEARLPVSAEFAVAPARLSFIVTGRGPGLQETREAIARQTHPACETLVAEDDAAALAALRQASGPFAALVERGDLPDRNFAERHLYMHHYIGALMVTASDFRMSAQGDPTQEGAYGRLKFWPARRRVPSLRQAAKGPWWAFSPRSGNVLRRTEMVALFAAHALERGLPPGVPLEWLLLHYATALGDGLQFAECLASLRLETGGPAGLHARQPADRRFVPRLAQPRCRDFYIGLLEANRERFAAYFGERLPMYQRWAAALDAAAPARAVRG